jgi:hypothetical protein
MADRINVVMRRGRILPCEGCKRKYKCGMYFSLTRYRMRDPTWTGGTPILHSCEIYSPDKIPGNLKHS